MTATDQSDAVVQTMRDMYSALSTDDEAWLRRLFAPSFYAFDLGRRFDGMALFELIRDIHRAGTTMVWKVTEPHCRVIGDSAWITFVNRGSVTGPDGHLPMTWLESAMLDRIDGAWRIVFFHSTRAPTA